MKSATLYFKRLNLRPDLNSKALESLENGGSLIFTKLDTRINSLPAGSKVYRWLNCLDSGPIPSKLYVAFVSSKGLHGDTSQMSTFFEPLNLTKLNVSYNGRPILVEPITAEYPTIKGVKTSVS